MAVLRSIAFNVWLNCSTNPSVWGWYGWFWSDKHVATCRVLVATWMWNYYPGLSVSHLEYPHTRTKLQGPLQCPLLRYYVELWLFLDSALICCSRIPIKWFVGPPIVASADVWVPLVCPRGSSSTSCRTPLPPNVMGWTGPLWVRRQENNNESRLNNYSRGTE